MSMVVIICNLPEIGFLGMSLITLTYVEFVQLVENVPKTITLGTCRPPSGETRGAFIEENYLFQKSDIDKYHNYHINDMK